MSPASQTLRGRLVFQLLMSALKDLSASIECNMKGVDCEGSNNSPYITMDKPILSYMETKLNHSVLLSIRN